MKFKMYTKNLIVKERRHPKLNFQLFDADGTKFAWDDEPNSLLRRPL